MVCLALALSACGGGGGGGSDSETANSQPPPITDTDGDGVADENDAFPNDATETRDTDDDGAGDNSDAFPNDASETADSDNDGIGDNSDDFPADPSRAKAVSVSTTQVAFTANSVSSEQVLAAIHGAIAGAAFIVKADAEHLVLPPTLIFAEPLIPVLHFTRYSSGDWVFSGSYENFAMGIARDFSILNEEQDAVFADTGLELSGVSPENWPHGHVNLARVNGGVIEWRQISQDRGFYHSVATGDFTGDGLTDIAAVYMGTKGNWWCDYVHAWVQTLAGEFVPTNCELPAPHRIGGAGAVEIEDIDGNGIAEIIVGLYGDNPSFDWDRYSYVIYSKAQSQLGYEVVAAPGPMGIFEDLENGATTIEFADFDSDGLKDFAVAYEAPNRNGIQVFFGRGGFSFEPGPVFEYPIDVLQFREFKILDVDEDGDSDIVLHPIGNGPGYRTRAGSSWNIQIGSLLLLNESGTLSQPINRTALVPDQAYWLKAFKPQNEPLRFISIHPSKQTPEDQSLAITEIAVDLRN